VLEYIGTIHALAQAGARHLSRVAGAVACPTLSLLAPTSLANRPGRAAHRLLSYHIQMYSALFLVFMVVLTNVAFAERRAIDTCSEAFTVQLKAVRLLTVARFNFGLSHNVALLLLPLTNHSTLLRSRKALHEKAWRDTGFNLLRRAQIVRRQRHHEWRLETHTAE